MTKTIKNNLIRVLTLIVAVACAFSILTMPKTSASADVATVGETDFWMEDSVELNATSEAKSGIRFTAGVSYAWGYDGSSAEHALSVLYKNAEFDFGIVIADKYYLDENGDVQERTDISVETDKAITIEYTKQKDFAGHFTNYKYYYTGAITYREDALKADFIAHDEAELLKPVEERKLYFTNGVYNDEEFAALMDRVHAEQLMARAYVKITKEDGAVEYLYSANTITNSVRSVANDKYFENKDDEEWMKNYGWIATKYLGAISYGNAYVDMTNGEVVGVDLRGYEEFIHDGQQLVVGQDIIVGETSYFTQSFAEGKEIGQTYTLTAYDANDNILFLNVTPITKAIKTGEEFKNIFNLSTNNEDFTKPTGSFYTCTVDGYYVLANDIDMTGIKLDHNLVCSFNNDTAAPSFGVGFYGTFDGNGHTIKNIDVSRSGAGIYQMTSNGNFLQVDKGEDGTFSSISTYLYYPTIAENHTCSHSSGTGVGVFGALGYGATIKNVSFDNAKASNSAFLAMFTEGAYNQDNGVSTYNAFGGFEALDSNNYVWRYGIIGTACTGADGCPVHGDEDCTATAGTKFIKCPGKFCYLHQTVEEHEATWVPVTQTGSSNDYVSFPVSTIMVRQAKMLTKAEAAITYENIYIDINSDTTNFRGVFNSFGASKVDAITTINNVVVNYEGAALTAENYGLLRGENKVATTGGQGIVFGSTTKNDVVIISKNTANLINYGGTYVASNLTGGTAIAGILQYASIEEYMDAIEQGTVSVEGFKNDYWNTDLGFPYWKGDYLDTITFKVDGVESDGTLEYTALADGTEKTFQINAYNYFGEAFEEFDSVESSNKYVATVTKNGLITLATSTQRDEATAVITLTVQGKVFTATITLQGGFTIISGDTQVTYSQDEGRFDFGGYAIDPDDDEGTDNSIVLTNDTIEEATVIYGNESTTLTKQTIQVKDYGELANPGYVGGSGLDTAGKTDDTMVDFNAFLGDNVVKYAVNGTNGDYTPVLYTQKLLVKVNVGSVEEPVYKTYLFENLKAYTAIINNLGKINELFSITTAGQSTAGYYILTNSIRGDRGIYKMNHVKTAVQDASTVGFQGVFDGQGYQIYQAITTENSYGGLFGRITSTKDMPTTIRNVSISAYAASASYALLAQSVVSDSYVDVLDEEGNDTGINASTYPVQIYNFHYKPYQKQIHGMFYATPGTVNYKFQNVLVNVENLSSYQTIGASNFFDGTTLGMLVNTGSYGYSNGDQITAIERFAKDAYYTDAYEQVAIISQLPIMLNVKNIVTNGVTGQEPLDTYHLAYGMNKVGLSGTKIAKYAQANAAATPSNSANLVFEVLASQATLTAADGTPWASALTQHEGITVEETTYVPEERAYFFKGVYQYYSFYEMNAQYENAESGEKAMYDEMVATGYFTKRTSDKKLIWVNAFGN